MTHPFLEPQIQGTAGGLKAKLLLHHRAPTRVWSVASVGEGIVGPRSWVVSQIDVPGEKPPPSFAASLVHNEVRRERRRRPDLPFHAKGSLIAVRLLKVRHANGVDDATLLP